MAKTPAVPEPSEQMVRLQQLFGSAVVRNDDDPEVAQMQMVERIFKGETLDDILGNAEAVHAKDVLGVPFQFNDVEFRESDEKYKGGIDVFAVAHVTNLRTGEKLVVTSGGTNVCAALLAIKQRDLFPFMGKYEEASKPTASGYTPLWLRQLRPNEIPIGAMPSDDEPL